MARLLLPQSGDHGSQSHDHGLCFLPFVVVGAVAWAASWLLLPPDVQAQICYAIVGLVAVHVIHTLVRSKWSPKALRHYEPMLENCLSRPLHCAIDGEQRVRDIRCEHLPVALSTHITQRLLTAVIAMDPLLHSNTSAWLAQAAKVLTKKLVPNLAARATSCAPASRAGHINNNARAAKIPAQPQRRCQRRVLSEGREVWFSHNTSKGCL